MVKKNKNKDTNSRRRRGSGTRTMPEPILLIVQGEYIVPLMRLTEKLLAQRCPT